MALVFMNPSQGQPLCWLCFIDWMVKLMGFQTGFWRFQHFALVALKASPTWEYHAELFRRYSPELSLIVDTHPSLLWDGLEVLDNLTPAVQALDQGEGSLAAVASNNPGYSSLESGMLKER